MRRERAVRCQNDLPAAQDRHPRQAHVRSVERLRKVPEGFDLSEIAEAADVEEAVIGLRSRREEETAAASRAVPDGGKEGAARDAAPSTVIVSVKFSQVLRTAKTDQR